MPEGAVGKHIVLILARELASNIASPMLIVDAEGTLVFYNEAAAQVLGRPFNAVGELPAHEWTALFRAETPEGVPLAPEDRPLTMALTRVRPVHRRITIILGDGVRRQIAVSAYPLPATPTQVVGAVSIFFSEENSEGG